ncbi:MAG TPA: glycosyltransferase family 4 protein [Gemmataceae bacterium]|nr:glycosyltransferase family 4 protein [Gemmataceae bacterium]
MPGIRILVATTHPTIVGGIETYLCELIPALRNRGYQVAILTSTGNCAEGPRLYPPDPEVPSWELAGADPRVVFDAVEAWGPDVAYLHGLEDAADEEALVERFPTVLFAHGHNATCVSGSRTHAFPTYRPCNRQFGPACLFHYFPRRCGGRNPLTMIGLYRQARRRAELLSRYAAVVVASRSMADEYRAHGVPEDRLHRIPLFPTGVTPDSAPTPRPGTGRVLMVGRLYPEKGGCLLVEAMDQAAARLGRPLRLIVAGNGPDQPRMEALAARRGVPAEFHGWVGPDRRADLMRGADLLAIPSVCPETFGLSGTEAGCLGLPAVGFAVGGLLDWLAPGVSGELAPDDPPTAAGLADAICRALADPVHLARLATGARAMAHSYSREAHVAAVSALLARAARQVPVAAQNAAAFSP